MSKHREEPFPENRTQTAESHPTHEEIALRAYQIYAERGGAHGQDVDDWLQAERELVAKYGETSLKAKAAAV
jgi:Protein of unknown function (DUF2934)